VSWPSSASSREGRLQPDPARGAAADAPRRGLQLQTAAELGVTVKTISFHLQKIYEKLQVHSKSQVVAKALCDRLVR